MPAIITHHIFGTEVYFALTSCIGGDEDRRLAFYLGNIGPDSLLCFKMLPGNVPYRRLGSIMHGQCTTQLLRVFHDRCIEASSDPVDGSRDIETADQGILRAYALGFLCHYLLDAAVHPLVYAQEHAISKQGVAGLAPRQVGGAAHALIETEIDELLLTRRYGVTVKDFVPHRQILVCPDKTLSLISKRYAAIVREVYGLQIPDWLFQSSVHTYRVAQVFLDSGRVGSKDHPSYASLLGPQYPHILALTHEARLRMATTFSNDDHVPWEHPFLDGCVVDKSFDDLYKEAYAKAIETIPRFGQADFSLHDCLELTGRLNFRGQPEQPLSSQ